MMMMMIPIVHLEGKAIPREIRPQDSPGIVKRRGSPTPSLSIENPATMFTPHLIQQQAQQGAPQSPLLVTAGPAGAGQQQGTTLTLNNGQPILQTSPTMMPQFFQTTPNQGSVYYTSQGQQIFNLPTNNGPTMVYQTQPQAPAQPPPPPARKPVSCPFSSS